MSNLKNEQAAKKLPLHLVPPALVEETALAFADGAKKYEPYNWRESGASVSVYYAAALRHLQAYWDGEDISPDARVNHLAHVAACMAVLLDCERAGNLDDDRPPAIKNKIPEKVSNTRKPSNTGQSIDPGVIGLEYDNVNHQFVPYRDNILNGGDM